MSHQAVNDKEGTDERRLLHGCHFELFDSNAN